MFGNHGASGDTELFEKASNINGFQGGRVANNLYISPFRATVFKTAALFLYLNSSVVIRVRTVLCSGDTLLLPQMYEGSGG